ncbi:hypothetical protein Rcae01_04960 [Novipirellula caenicola]|uniref:Uncharacterized protein n=1 Tax=Novipirellula caenicola TaxID=1536901 RepID=A0ABP9VWH8_9BACT
MRICGGAAYFLQCESLPGGQASPLCWGHCIDFCDRWSAREASRKTLDGGAAMSNTVGRERIDCGYRKRQFCQLHLRPKPRRDAFLSGSLRQKGGLVFVLKLRVFI